MLARVLTATVILFLPAAATDCPVGWTPSPTSATCFFVPHERSTSLFRCVDLCEEYEGIPACIGSAEENKFVAGELATADGLWLGLYQNETGLGPTKGWGRCVAGDAPNFTNWQEGQPNDFAYQEDCAFLNARAGGQWSDVECQRTFSQELFCLCALGNASDAFTYDLEVLEATGAYNQLLLRRRTAIAFAAAIAIAVATSMTSTASRATSSRAVFTGCHRRLHCHCHGARAHRHRGANAMAMSAAACLQQTGGGPKLPFKGAPKGAPQMTERQRDTGESEANGELLGSPDPECCE